MKQTTGHGSRVTTHDALLEIGSEELPATFIGLGIAQLKTLAETSLKENGLPFTAVHTYGTPRRLAVVLSGLPDRSPDQEKMIPGPPVERGKDASGQWTQAAIGFAAKNGLRPEQLTAQSGRLCAVLNIKGVPTRQLLAQLFPNWVRQLQFPKTMVWEPTQMKYPRPLRWMAALYGSDIVSFGMAGVKAGRTTFGLGPWAPKKITITHAGKYAMLLKNQCVLVEPQARQDAIRRYADQAVKRVHGKLHLSLSLLEQVSNLVEHPVAIVGGFDPEYLALPKEVLITCLEHHQKYFPVTAPHPNPLLKGEGERSTGEAKLLPYFVGIRNGMSVNQEGVREGYERVLSARLADARFFYQQDRKEPLAARVDALKGVMFQAKLGHLFDKKERVKRLLDLMSTGLGGFQELEKAKRVADLGKADLVTDMVREFPELQGIMARLYATADGEDPVVSKALEEHYWPITLSGPLPSSDVAALVALADKLDTLAGDFAVGLIPSGSADPYGLRRAAVGVLRILEERQWALPLETLIDQAVRLQPVQGHFEDTIAKLNQFFKQRLAATLEERGFKPDEIDSILATGLGVVSKTVERLKAIQEFRTLPEFDALASSFKRAANIVRQAAEKKIELNGDSRPQEPLFLEPCERALWERFTAVEGQLKGDDQASVDVLKALVPLREPLSQFFEGVMVMAEDPAVRHNRLKLLFQITKLFKGIADFSKIQHG